MRRIATLALLLLPACGLSEERFLVDGLAELCDAVTACDAGVPHEACVDALREVDRSSCDYDPKAARDCLKDLDAAECTTHDATDRKALVLPATCDEVYPGCPMLYEAPYAPGW